MAKRKPKSKSEIIESYFTREDSSHDNSYYFSLYTSTKASGIFDDLELPLKLYDIAVSTFIKYRDKPVQAVEKYMQILNDNGLNNKQKILFLDNLSDYLKDTEFPINDNDDAVTFRKNNELLGIEKRLLEADEKKQEKLIKEIAPTQSEQSVFNGLTNSQIVLLFYYFFRNNGLEPRTNIDIAPIAKFIHLITGKDFKGTTSSDIYKKLQTVPNFKSDKSLVQDLEMIKSRFEKVQLNDLVKLVDREIDIARNELKQKKPQK